MLEILGFAWPFIEKARYCIEKQRIIAQHIFINPKDEEAFKQENIGLPIEFNTRERIIGSYLHSDPLTPAGHVVIYSNDDFPRCVVAKIVPELETPIRVRGEKYVKTKDDYVKWLKEWTKNN